jgi:succinate dehydrogenase / fumarate reductase cytochrome b subunit
MNTFRGVLTSSLGRKLMMALSGLFLCSFLVVHLTINLFVLKDDGGREFDAYAEFMATYPLIRPLEIVLFAGFVLHMALGIALWLANRRVRPTGYAVSPGTATSTVSSRIMWITGGVVLVFLVVHVNAFFVRSRFFPDGRPMYELVREAFADPVRVAFYLVALLVLGYHLRHGFQSAFQTFGLHHGRYAKLIEAAGVVFWLFVPLGFALIPLAVLWSH